MKWSKIKKQIESGISPTLKGRVQFYITSYGSGIDTTDYYNRGWITVDKNEVVNFCSATSFELNGRNYHFATPTESSRSAEITFTRNLGSLSEPGEFSKFDLLECCLEYLQLSINESLNHQSPIIQMLAVLDKRTGKRTLIKIKETELHPLVKYFLNLRLKTAEKIIED